MKKINKDDNNVLEQNVLNNDLEAVKQKIAPVICVMDSSNSMNGIKIDQVNYAMRDLPEILKEISDNAPNAEIRMVSVSFANTVDWNAPQLQTPEEFKRNWTDIKADGMTCMGACLKSLNENMSRKKLFKNNAVGYSNPMVLCLGDGAPTDDWQTPLAELMENNWFKKAIKVGFAVGEDANIDVLAKICGSKEAIVTINDIEKLRDYITFVTATVSQTCTSGDVSIDPQEAVNEALQLLDEDDDVLNIVDPPVVDDDQF